MCSSMIGLHDLLLKGGFLVKEILFLHICMSYVQKVLQCCLRMPKEDVSYIDVKFVKVHCLCLICCLLMTTFFFFQSSIYEA